MPLFRHNPLAQHRRTRSARVRTTLASTSLTVFALGAAAGGSAIGLTLATTGVPAPVAAPNVILPAPQTVAWASDARHVEHVEHVCHAGQRLPVSAAIRDQLWIPQTARAVMCVTQDETFIVHIDPDGQIAEDWNS